MKPQYRDILKHSGIYGLGQLLSRLVSVLMLPVYTRYLQPADYGSIAILDLTGGILGIIVGGGMVAALSRYHFEASSVDEQNSVWWTGLVAVVAVATAVVAPAFVLRSLFATVTLGAETANGSYFYALMLPTVWLLTIAQIPDQYMRIRKWSWLTVVVSVGVLVLNIAINIYFLAVLDLSVSGVLLGNLIGAFVSAAVRLAIMARACGTPRVRWSLVRPLWQFGTPIVATGLLALVMHQADRYVLRLSWGLDEVGIYSLAYTVGQGLNSTLMVPFVAIWGVVVYEIAHLPDAKHVYARVFEYYVYSLMLFLFGVSLFVRPLLAAFLPAEYGAAAPLIPVVCLGFIFFSIHEHFKVPALLAKRTVTLLLAFTSGAIANVVLNLLVLPRYGAAGAAWTSVATYLLFSGVGLATYRRIDRYEYPLLRCATVLLALIGSYIGCQYVYESGVPRSWSVVVAAVVWIGWGIALLHPLLRKQLLRQAYATAS